MRASDVFVFPTEQEGMGNVVLEAMASAIPCVITEFHGLPEKEFGKAGEEFVLVPRTQESLADGLVHALQEPGRSVVMGGRGHDWVNQKMSFDLTIERYARLYLGLAGLA
jgi:glycosyltransferase involved in cell wall biosynthesis